MSFLDAIILGIVEGITEYLPISSTGHLIITKALLGLDASQVDAYLIIIQGGAILAVLGLYWSRVKQMLAGLVGRDAAGRKLLINLFIAFLPAAVLGVLLDDLIEHYLFKPIPVVIALAAGGVVMIVLKRWQQRFFHEAMDEEHIDAHAYVDIEHLTWRRALLIGFLQCVAMWPGTSRSMMTIVGGMVAGMRPKHAAEFSFLLGLPTLGGACVYKLGKSGSGLFETIDIGPFVLGIAVATISAAFAIKWLVGYLARHSLAVFGWYRIVFAAVIAIMVARGLLTIAPQDEPAEVDVHETAQTD